MSDADGMKKPPQPSKGDVLHQSRRLGKSPVAMAVCGVVIVATIGYFTLYTKAKPETSSAEVGKMVGGGRAK
ncbi:hypothetical protein HPP92_010499 [Vanilla planifolia]|uniref:Uncharacterized protein n=1 Tax=Vanilla planifolia TaxID=51239 RepID=A0A835QXQ3_VANPL|nr:hypothetical protein HPP92_010736 [Vanilla planifolia]KAG0482415.1 hypothetical protein HPP92_010499 [Vanilla planifolia]